MLWTYSSKRGDRFYRFTVTPSVTVSRVWFSMVSRVSRGLDFENFGLVNVLSLIHI